VVDFFGGQRDLKERTIRILHNLSFIDDPTRMIRAVRFEQKFGFTIGKHTEYLMRGALKKGYLHRAQGSRTLHELMAILRDTEPQKSFERMGELGILKALHPAMALNNRTREAFRQVERIHSWFQLLYTDDEPDAAEIYFNVLILLKKAEAREEILDLFKTPDTRREEYLARWASISDTLRALSRRSEAKSSWISRTLQKLSTEDLLTVMSLTKRETSIRHLSLYLSRLRYIRRELDGKALRKMGYKSGPRFREILQAVQDARVDGVVSTLAEEKEWVLKKFPVN
jgi:tRNA nucleotidyltransferase (CCA-adding enzyme)